MILDGEDVAATTDEILAWLRNVEHVIVPAATLRTWIHRDQVARMGRRDGRQTYSLEDAVLLATRDTWLLDKR